MCWALYIYIPVPCVYGPADLMKSIKLTCRFSGWRARDAGGAADAVVVDAGSASPCAASGAASGTASGSASGAAAGALSTGRLDGPDNADDPSESVAV